MDALLGQYRLLGLDRGLVAAVAAPLSSRRTAPSLLRCFRLLPSSLPRVEGRESAVDARLPRGGSSAASRSAKLTRLGGRLDVPGRLPWPVGGRRPGRVVARLRPAAGRRPAAGGAQERVHCVHRYVPLRVAGSAALRAPAGARMIPSRGGIVGRPWVRFF